MSSTTITLVDKADANVVYTRIGESEKGATYRDASRTLGLPRSLNFQYQIGSPGALGNDRITMSLKNSVSNSETGKVSTGSVSIALSIPRDASWSADDTEDLLIQLQTLFTDANAALIADGITP